MGYSMEFHGTLESPNKKSPSSIVFHGIRRAPFQMTQVFHGIPWNIPWNSMELWYRIMKYNLVPWNSMEYSMEFHGTLVPPYEISLSSMEIPYNFEIVILFNTMLPWTSMGYSMEFHVTLESLNKKHQSSMGFHGFRRAPFQMTQVFHGIPWNIPWNSMELWCRQMKYHLVPWNITEPWDFHFINTMLPWTSTGYSLEFHGILESPNQHSPRIPWN